jgi:hypothetical protein
MTERHFEEVIPGVTLTVEVDDDFEGTVEPRYEQDTAKRADFIEAFNRTDDGPLVGRVMLLRNDPATKAINE